MSFATNVKNEITKFEGTKTESIALLSGFIRNNGTIEENNIVLLTENATIAKKIYQLIKDIYHVTATITQAKNMNFSKTSLYYIKIDEKKDEILEDLSVYEQGKYLEEVKEYIVAEEEEIRCYLMGAFLSKGSVNDPKTARYHLEFLVERKKEAEFIKKLLNYFHLNSKILNRDKGYMVYIKEAEKIGDFLRIVYASNAVMYYEDIRIYRDHKNMTNRLNNCEQANIDKIVETATNQIKEIEYLKEMDVFDLLDEKTKQAAEYRLKYPESSLVELSEIISYETNGSITKSGLNHRFRKIKELVKRIKENE